MRRAIVHKKGAADSANIAKAARTAARWRKWGDGVAILRSITGGPIWPTHRTQRGKWLHAMSLVGSLHSAGTVMQRLWILVVALSTSLIANPIYFANAASVASPGPLKVTAEK